MQTIEHNESKRHLFEVPVTPASWSAERRSRYVTWRRAASIYGYLDPRTRAMQPPLADIFEAAMEQDDAQDAEEARQRPVSYGMFWAFVMCWWGAVLCDGIVGLWQQYVDGVPITHPYVSGPGIVAGLLLGALLGACYGLCRARRVRQQVETTNTLK
ncbi:MAG: hypothetical protein J0H27_08900 [Xanthomonadales bacterium]|mgnify:FL=1|nr:hypothetical protein [Xanthomonadales bacterium]